MYKPFSTDPKCCFSVSMPISMLKAIDEHLNGRSRSEFIRAVVKFWFREKIKTN